MAEVPVNILIEIDHSNNLPRVVFSTTDPRKLPDASCNWAIDKRVPLSRPVSMELLDNIPRKLSPLLRLSSTHSPRFSLYLCRQVVEVKP